MLSFENKTLRKGTPMSGYLGNPDAEAEHCLILAENAIHAARSQMYDTSHHFEECRDCGELIPEARRIALPGVFRCICCQQQHEHTFRRPSIRMLDHIL